MKTGYYPFIKVIVICLLPLIIQSCGIFGIHLQVHNPGKEGKVPEFDREKVLLGELTPYRSCFDVHYYDLSVKVLPDENAIEGEVILYAMAVEDFDTIQIDLDNRFEILRLRDFTQVIFYHIPEKRGPYLLSLKE